MMLTDVFSPEKRSWVMSRIRSKNTSIDIKMKDILSDNGHHFEMYPKMYGNPDFANKKERIVVFCDGDFWHGYRYYEKKRLSRKFWRDKIELNMKRDKKIRRKLRYEGWSVLQFWEHDIKRKPEKCISKIGRKAGKRSRSF